MDEENKTKQIWYKQTETAHPNPWSILSIKSVLSLCTVKSAHSHVAKAVNLKHFHVKDPHLMILYKGPHKGNVVLMFKK